MKKIVTENLLDRGKGSVGALEQVIRPNQL